APVTESAGNSRLGNSASATLSDREFDVARLVVSGKTYVEIGAALFISPRTVEHHVAHMRRRLDATSRSDLIAKLRLAIDPSEHPDEPVPADPPKIPSTESPSRQVRV